MTQEKPYDKGATFTMKEQPYNEGATFIMKEQPYNEGATLWLNYTKKIYFRIVKREK